jgi:hypothetical protein
MIYTTKPILEGHESKTIERIMQATCEKSLSSLITLDDFFL